MDIQNLYLCDIICHGVPSPRAFKDYISWLDEKEGQKTEKYYFRNKSVSWRGDSAVVKTEKDEIKSGKNVSAFMNLYYSNNITNDACFDCKFTSLDRISDITLSDFWGIENENPKFEDELGVSMVMLNTKKGEELFSQLDGESVRASLDNAKQPQLHKPTEKPDTYCDFWKNYKVKGIEYVLKEYGLPKASLKTRIYNLIYRK